MGCYEMMNAKRVNDVQRPQTDVQTCRDGA